MLKGKLFYKDENISEVVSFDVYAQDTMDTLKLYVMNEDMTNFSNARLAKFVFDMKEVVYGDEEIHKQEYIQREMVDGYPDVNHNRRLDIGSSKTKTNVTNPWFASRVSALVRWSRMQGKENYNMNVVSDGEGYFNPKRVVSFDKEGVKGAIEYDTGLITMFDVTGHYVRLVLHHIDDALAPAEIFGTLKEKNNYGNILSPTPVINLAYSLDKTTLGFNYISNVMAKPADLFGLYDTLDQVFEAHPNKNFRWIEGRHYEVLTDANFEAVIDDFMNFDGFIAYDTETTGLKINFKSRLADGTADELVGVVLSKEVGTGYYIPLQQKLFDNVCGGDHWYFMERYMKPLLEKKKIVCHNMVFDWKVSYIYGINANIVYDTMLALGVTKRYEQQNFETGLKDVIRNFFGLDMMELGDFMRSGKFGDSDITFADLPYALVKNYAPVDGDATLMLKEFIDREGYLDKYDARKVFEMEVNFAKVVAYSEFHGYHVATDKIPQMREEIEGGMEKHKQKMFAIAGKEFNPASPKQLTEIMYDEMGIEMIGGKRTTNKEALGSLAERENEMGEPLYPFVTELTKYRQNEGIYKNFLKRLHEFSTEDGFIFPGVFQLGTDTGRASVKNPNYQSYNDAVKKNITPRKGFWHFDSDFSQIEYRVLASMAQQENLIKEFEDPDLDYHTYQASRMFSIPYALVPKSLRSQSKGINFGLPYGMGDNSLGARIFGERNKVNERKAAALRKKFFQGQENILEFFENVRSSGVSQSYTSTYFGRRRYYHRGTFSVSSIRRQAGNHVIQGTAADIYKIACNRLFNRIVAEGWLDKVLINVFVHDELLNEVSDEINPYYFFKAWREEFELNIKGFCKLFAGAGVGYSWYEAKKQDLPPQYISEIINKYTPEMPWDGNISKFMEDVEKGYEEYKVRRVKEHITDPANQGEILKPIINSLLVEVVGNIVKEVAKDPVRLSSYNSLFDKPLLTEDGKHKLKSLSDYLDVFTYYYNMDKSTINVKSPEEADIPKSTPNTEESSYEISLTQDDYSIGDLVELRGYYLDTESEVIYFRDTQIVISGIDTTIQMYLASKGVFQAEGRYQVALYDSATKDAILYNAYVSVEGYSQLVSTYNMLNRPSFAF